MEPSSHRDHQPRQLVGKCIAALLAGLIIFSVFRESGVRSIRAAPNSEEVILRRDALASTRQVGQGLVLNSPLADFPLSIEFHVLESPGFINAFVIPNGQVYITRELYALLSTEGELAALLAHELGHIWMGNTTGSVAPGDPPDEGPANPELSRENELKADILGMCILVRSGYDPGNMARMVEVFKQVRSAPGQIPAQQSTHPDPDDRIRIIYENLEKLDDCPK